MSAAADKPKQYPEQATPAPVGSGPTGRTCGSCDQVVRKGGKHLACGRSPATRFSERSGSSQNVGFDWPACEHWWAGSALRIFDRVRLAWGSDETFDRASLVVAGDWLAEHEHDHAAEILRDWPFSVSGLQRCCSPEQLDAIFDPGERPNNYRDALSAALIARILSQFDVEHIPRLPIPRDWMERVAENFEEYSAELRQRSKTPWLEWGPRHCFAMSRKTAEKIQSESFPMIERRSAPQDRLTMFGMPVFELDPDVFRQGDVLAIGKRAYRFSQIIQSRIKGKVVSIDPPIHWSDTMPGNWVESKPDEQLPF